MCGEISKPSSERVILKNYRNKLSIKCRSAERVRTLSGSDVIPRLRKKKQD